MSEDLAVDFAALDAIAVRLNTAAEALGRTGSSMPTTVSDGLGGPATARILQHLVTNAGNVCGALEVLAAGVTEARSDFEADDRAQGARLGRMVAE